MFARINKKVCMKNTESNDKNNDKDIKNNSNNPDNKDSNKAQSQAPPKKNGDVEEKKDQSQKEKTPSDTGSDEFSIYNYIKNNYKDIFIVFLLLALITVFAWSYFNLKKQERLFEQEYENLYTAAQNFSQKKDTLHLKNLALSFSYAIVSERLQNNIGNMNAYATGLLHNDNNISDIVIANEEGQIIATTNKKYENVNLRDFLLINFIRFENITIKSDKEEGRLLVFAPLKAFNKSWGYLVFRYQLEPFVYEKN